MDWKFWWSRSTENSLFSIATKTGAIRPDQYFNFYYALYYISIANDQNLSRLTQMQVNPDHSQKIYFPWCCQWFFCCKFLKFGACQYYLLPTELEGHTVNYGPCFSPLIYAIKGDKQGCVICITGQENEGLVRYLLYLFILKSRAQEGKAFQFKFSGSYCRIWLPKLTSHSAPTI